MSHPARDFIGPVIAATIVLGGAWAALRVGPAVGQPAPALSCEQERDALRLLAAGLRASRDRLEEEAAVLKARIAAPHPEKSAEK